MVTLIAAHEHGLLFSGSVVLAAISAGRVAVVQYLVSEQRLTIPRSAKSTAGDSGSMEMLQFVRERDCRLDASTCTNVATRGHLPALIYLHEIGCDWSAHRILDDAADSGNLDMVKWLLQQDKVDLTSSAMASAAANGHTAVCAYLLSQQCPWDSTAWYQAAYRKQHSTLQWLHSRGCPFDVPTACERAALRGHIDTIEYILQLHSTALNVPHACAERCWHIQSAGSSAVAAAARR